ncbi:MAG: hypothetical protein ACE5KT_11505 [Methanosarcinales archaeon]
MVMRTIEVRKIRFLIHKDKMEQVIEKLKKINRNLEITVNDNELQVAGDFRNTKMCGKVLKLLWSESYG